MMVNGYWSIWIDRCDPLDFLIIRWNLGNLDPLFAPLQHLWIPDCLTSDIFHFFPDMQSSQHSLHLLW